MDQIFFCEPCGRNWPMLPPNGRCAHCGAYLQVESLVMQATTRGMNRERVVDMSEPRPGTRFKHHDSDGDLEVHTGDKEVRPSNYFPNKHIDVSAEPERNFHRGDPYNSGGRSNQRSHGGYGNRASYRDTKLSTSEGIQGLNEEEAELIRQHRAEKARKSQIEQPSLREDGFHVTESNWRINRQQLRKLSPDKQNVPDEDLGNVDSSDTPELQGIPKVPQAASGGGIGQRLPSEESDRGGRGGNRRRRGQGGRCQGGRCQGGRGRGQGGRGQGGRGRGGRGHNSEPVTHW